MSLATHRSRTLTRALAFAPSAGVWLPSSSSQFSESDPQPGMVRGASPLEPPEEGSLEGRRSGVDRTFGLVKALALVSFVVPCDGSHERRTSALTSP